MSHRDKHTPYESSESGGSRKGSGKPSCDLCGFPLGRSPLELCLNGRKLRFCCPGCRMVFEVLFNRPDGPPSDFRETDLFRACVQAGIIDPPPQEDEVEPTGANDLERSEAQHATQGQASSGHPGGLTDQHLSLHIGGMWCAACGLLLESLLKNTTGVLEARVHFLTDSAQIRFLPHLVNPQFLMERIAGVGYTAHLPSNDSQSHGEKRSLLIRLGIAAILTCNIMMIACALYFDFFEDIGDDGVRYLTWAQWLLATPVVFYAGAPILKKAFLGARWGMVSMETLISIGSLAAYFYSAGQTFAGSVHVYFDTASMLITLVLLGKAIETGARENVSHGVMQLLQCDGEKTRLVRGTREKWVSSRDVAIGDLFLVREGERVPMDGEIVEGRGDLDESILTGESRPTRKHEGHNILNGSILLNGILKARVVRASAESVLQQMITMIQQALAAKVDREQAADRIIGWVVPGVILLALATGVEVLAVGSGGEEALKRALTVLVITCPCALGIAVPLAKVASISAARCCGLIVRKPTTLDVIGSVNGFVFDKTGTLTEGAFRLRDVVAPRDDPREVMTWLASVEAGSQHLIAREIMRRSRTLGIEPEECVSFEEIEGLGVCGQVGGHEILVGNRRLMAERGCQIPTDLDRASRTSEAQGMTTPFFARAGSVRGFLSLGDEIRPDACQVIRTLRDVGSRIWIISGDSQETTDAMSKDLCVDGALGGMHPSEKAEFVRGLQREGFRIAVVGDGVNDAAALALADVAISVGSRADLLKEVADITLLHKGISPILDGVALGRLHQRVSSQNLFFAFAYNTLAIPIAMAGLLNPIIAVLAMFLSSLTVLASTLRISRFTPTKD